MLGAALNLGWHVLVFAVLAAVALTIGVGASARLSGLRRRRELLTSLTRALRNKKRGDLEQARTLCVGVLRRAFSYGDIATLALKTLDELSHPDRRPLLAALAQILSTRGDLMRRDHRGGEEVELAILERQYNQALDQYARSVDA